MNNARDFHGNCQTRVYTIRDENQALPRPLLANCLYIPVFHAHLHTILYSFESLPPNFSNSSSKEHCHFSLRSSHTLCLCHIQRHCYNFAFRITLNTHQCSPHLIDFIHSRYRILFTSATRCHLRIQAIIYHDFHPPPMRRSHVKTDNTHTIIKQIYLLAHILDTSAFIFSSCALFTVYPNRIM